MGIELRSRVSFHGKENMDIFSGQILTIQVVKGSGHQSLSAEENKSEGLEYSVSVWSSKRYQTPSVRYHLVHLEDNYMHSPPIVLCEFGGSKEKLERTNPGTVISAERVLS